MAPVPPSLLLFARAPQVGRVKTRLTPAIGAAGAALLYRAFLEDAARTYGFPASWSPVLWADPDPGDPGLAALFGSPWRVHAQPEGDLGARLAAAFREEFARGSPAAVAVGSDHPALPRRRIEEVFERLDSGLEAALIPAEDGGYCAIGLRVGTPVEEVFREIPWSSAEVLSATLGRLSRIGLRFELLPGSFDVDRPEDLARLRAEVDARDPSEPDYPSATAVALASLGRRGAP
ncbi:MAG: TIGR04282 family arsenosugar biosynthesis glycosyltransferase [Acidobacteriota bacterium]